MTRPSMLGLRLTAELLRRRTRLLLIVTQRDVLDREGRTLDVDALALALGIPVIAVSALDPAARPTYAIMMKIYRGLLNRIERSRYDVHTRRIRISAARKIGIVAGAWIGSHVGRLGFRRRKG